ncbi:MAG: amidase [Pseudomonadaceae bacterium]|nr:amidase [Pseudomonadaceae bacterium]
MAANSDLAMASASELTAAMDNGSVSSVELLDLYLERVDEFNADINAIIFEDRDGARAQAAEADEARRAGKKLGSLHGLPMTVKESYDVTGMPSTWGATDLRDNIASEDALSITRLRDQGAVIFGKTNVPLMLADFQSYNDVYGTTKNPYDHSRTPGGSSGGSAAALAAGLTGLETGSDIGGSIRNPAHFCGVFGHKPTWNVIPMRGHAMPGVLTPSDISVLGPLARSAQDLDIALRAMAGPDEIMGRGYQLALPEFESSSLAGLRVALWSDDERAPVDAEVKARVELVGQAFRDAGASVIDARPEFESDHTHLIYNNLLHPVMASRTPDEQYQKMVERVQQLDPNDDSDGARVLRAQVSNYKDWANSNEARTHLRWHWHEFFKNVDLLLTPIMPAAAWPHDHSAFGERTITVNNEQRPYFEQTFWAGLTGVSYLPSTVIPTGLNGQGLPIGIQIVGPEFGDLQTIGAARLLEQEGFVFTPPPAYV